MDWPTETVTAIVLKKAIKAVDWPTDTVVQKTAKAVDSPTDTIVQKKAIAGFAKMREFERFTCLDRYSPPVQAAKPSSGPPGPCNQMCVPRSASSSSNTCYTESERKRESERERERERERGERSD